MLRRASVQDVESGRVSRDRTRLAVVMRHYPRFLKREKVDDYFRELAPPDELFNEFKAKQRKLANHNSAFALVSYEKRFDLSEKGRKRLEELSRLSHEREIVLICQCRDYERCHTDLLLIWARDQYGAAVAGLIFEYSDFRPPAPGSPPNDPPDSGQKAEPL